MRLEVVFNSAEAALAVGGRLSDAVARTSKGRVKTHRVVSMD
jgi:hypothetical protein